MPGFEHWSQRTGRTEEPMSHHDYELASIGWELERLGLQNERILDLLHQILNRETHMDTELTTLTDAVEAEGSVVDSAIVLLEQLVADIEAEKNDPIAIQAIVDSVNAQKQKLTDAIVANTPAAPPTNDGTGTDNPNAGDTPPAGAGDTSTEGDPPIAGDAPVATPDTPVADPAVDDGAAVNPPGSDTFTS